MKQEILEIIAWFQGKGYRVEMTTKSIKLLEAYRSLSRNKFISLTICEMCCSEDILSEKKIRKTLNTMREWKDNLNQ